MDWEAESDKSTTVWWTGPGQMWPDKRTRQGSFFTITQPSFIQQTQVCLVSHSFKC